jgi:hypothetical protein
MHNGFYDKELDGAQVYDIRMILVMGLLKLVSKEL